jgi:hypothetical protein
MSNQTILWRRLDEPGYESARLDFEDSAWRLAGTAVFTHDRRPCRLDYLLVCDSQWQTLSASVAGWIGDATVKVDISVDGARRWRLNGIECQAVAGCFDLDLSFSPSTNLLPIRRLRLAVGEEAGVKAAWLRFPDFTLEPLNQSYRRIAAAAYRYEADAGRFITELAVNESGFVTSYPNFWEIESFT